MEAPTLEDFLLRALPWPDPHSPVGWVNLHWNRPDNKRVTGGQAFKTIEDVIGFIEWSKGYGKGKVADLYYCTSLQADHGMPKKTGKYSALRSVDNALSSKLLFADVDKYASKEAALRAIHQFCEKSQSPFPTAIIDSGGGYHVYWILPDALPREQWLDLAHKFNGLITSHGLLHDNVSTDMARILRPPETLNWKRVAAGIPPVPVVLKLLNGTCDLASWKSLHNAAPTAAIVRTGANASVAVEHLFVDPEAMKTGPAPAFRNKVPLEEIVGDGTLSPFPIFKLCPMFRDTVLTGGKDVGQPVWHQQALAATFLDGGRDLFHRLGNRHPGYTFESSEDMYTRKLRDRASKGLGYPSCAAFQADGATQCAGCHLRGTIASPLNITAALLPPPSTPPSGGPKDAPANDNSFDTPPEHPTQKYLPRDGYRIGEGGYIEYEVSQGKKPKWVQLYQSQVIPVDIDIAEETDGRGIHIRYKNPLEDWKPLAIPARVFGDTSGLSLNKVLNDGGCLTMGHPGAGMNLMLTFRGRLAEEKRAQRMVPYGWEYADRKEGESQQGHPIGFSYNKVVYSPGGVQRPTGGGDIKLQDTYCVTGAPEAWINALRVILRMETPALATVVLASFAAPLMIFSGQPSTVVMARGQSGGSKSTAMAVASAVWARPRTAMIKPSSSRMGVMKRSSKIRNMPVFWDDIRNDQFENVKDTLMEITQGGEGLKLDQNRDEREQGVWDNMLLTSSNNSLIEYLENISKNDGAALVRCFEFEVPKVVAGTDAYQDPNRVSRLVADLDSHHGHAGREYAAIIGSDPAALQNMYNDVAERVVQKVTPFQPHERFWMAAAATILMAGMLANSLPIMRANALKFNLDALEKFLVKIYLEHRLRYANANIHADSSEFAKRFLEAFINHAGSRNESVWTNGVPAGAGKPVFSSPLHPLGDDFRRMRRVSVRFIHEGKKIRFSKTAFDEYLKENKVSVDRVREGLTEYYNAQVVRVRLAGGLLNISAQAVENVYEIEIRDGSWLDDLLQTHVMDDPQNIVPLRPAQTQSPPETHPQPGHEDPEGEKDAS